MRIIKNIIILMISIFFISFTASYSGEPLIYPPNISITFPVNNSVYFDTSIDLNFTSNETLVSANYSLDGGIPTTTLFSCNVTNNCVNETLNITDLTNIELGKMDNFPDDCDVWVDVIGEYKGYYNNVGGYTDQSESLDKATRIYIECDTSIYNISVGNFVTLTYDGGQQTNVYFPESNKTHFSQFEIYRMSSDGSTYYNWLDDQTQTYNLSQGAINIVYNLTLTNLSEGEHNITIYGENNDDVNGQSSYVYFTINKTPQWSNNQTNVTSETKLNDSIQMSVELIDNYLLDSYIFSSNISGFWINDTPEPAFSGYCYQESANESDQTGIDGNCVLNYSGNYNTWGDTWDNVGNLYDGDGDTYTYNSWDDVGAYLDIIYIKPSINLNNPIIEVEEATFSTPEKTNYSLPSDCLNTNENNITLIYYEEAGAFPDIFLFCVNDSSWEASFLNNNLLHKLVTVNSFFGGITNLAVLWNYIGTTTTKTINESKSKHKAWTVYFNDTINNKNQTDIFTFNIKNILPNVTISLLPSPVGTTDDIYISDIFYDSDGDLNVDNETRWYKNGIENISWINQTIIGNTHSNNLSSGDTIKASIKVYDGFNWSDWVNTSQLTIDDSTPPSFINCSLQYSTLTDASGNTNIFSCTVSDTSSNIDYIKFNLETPNSNLSRTMALNGTGKHITGTYSLFQSSETLTVGSYSVTNSTFSDSSGNVGYANITDDNFTITSAPVTESSSPGGSSSSSSNCGLLLYQPREGTLFTMRGTIGKQTAITPFTIKNDGNSSGTYEFSITNNDFLVKNCEFGSRSEIIEPGLSFQNSVQCSVDQEIQEGNILIKGCNVEKNYRIQVGSNLFLLIFRNLVDGNPTTILGVSIPALFMVGIIAFIVFGTAILLGWVFG